PSALACSPQPPTPGWPPSDAGHGTVVPPPRPRGLLEATSGDGSWSGADTPPSGAGNTNPSGPGSANSARCSANATAATGGRVAVRGPGSGLGGAGGGG